MLDLTKEMLVLAEELSKSNNEVKLRASIGRSYYCAFHCCLDDLDIKDTSTLVGGRGGTHQKVADLYLNGANKAVAYMLTALKKKRHHADYDLSNKIEQEDVVMSLETVNNILEKIGKNI